MPLPVALPADGSAGRHMRASSSMPWNRPSLPEGLLPVTAWCIIRIAAASMSRSSIPSVSPKPVWSLPWAAPETHMATPLPRRLSVCSRPRSSIGAARGNRLMPSNTSRSNGSTGSTTGEYWSPSGTSRPQRQRTISMQPNRKPIWLHAPNQIASGVTGEVHFPTRYWASASPCSAASSSDFVSSDT